MARHGPGLAEHDIDEISVDDLVRRHLGPAFGLERVGRFGIAGDQRIAMVERPAGRGAEHHIAFGEFVRDQDHGQGRALGKGHHTVSGLIAGKPLAGRAVCRSWMALMTLALTDPVRLAGSPTIGIAVPAIVRYNGTIPTIKRTSN